MSSAAVKSNLQSNNNVKKSTSTQFYQLEADGKQELPNQVTIDWHRGILNQLSIVSDCYLEWIDHAQKNNTQIRMFDSDLLESMSFTPWWVIPCFYVPFGLLELMKSVYDYETYADEAPNTVLYLTNGNRVLITLCSLVIFLLGVQGWTLFEYFCHRFLFHMKPDTSSYTQTWLHFLGHGIHHLTPTDAYRLVFPPAISFPLALVFRFVFYTFLFPAGMAAAFCGGFIVGYAGYESTHFLTHHCTEDRYPMTHYLLGHYLANRDKWHSMHHYCESKYDKLYGVTSQMWDVVFNTM